MQNGSYVPGKVQSGDADLAEFPLNLEYLEAEFFLFGALGYGLDVVAPDLPAGGPQPVGGIKANLSPIVHDIILEFAYQEVGHLRAIKATVPGFPRSLLNPRAIHMHAVCLTTYPNEMWCPGPLWFQPMHRMDTKWKQLCFSVQCWKLVRNLIHLPLVVCLVRLQAAVMLNKDGLLMATLLRLGLQQDVCVGNALCTMFVKCGNIVSACQMFDKMPERNVISWTAICTGYVESGDIEQAFNIFRLIWLLGIKPNQFTYTSILSVCGCFLAEEVGKQIHACIIKIGFEQIVPVDNVMVDMYAKCGNMVGAHKLFDRMSVRNLVSCNAIIVG